MGLCFSVTCDRKGCKAGHSITFEREEETYGDLLQVLRDAGWTLGEAVLCPDCGGDEERDD